MNDVTGNNDGGCGADKDNKPNCGVLMLEVMRIEVVIAVSMEIMVTLKAMVPPYWFIKCHWWKRRGLCYWLTPDGFGPVTDATGDGGHGDAHGGRGIVHASNSGDA